MREYGYRIELQYRGGPMVSAHVNTLDCMRIGTKRNLVRLRVYRAYNPQTPFPVALINFSRLSWGI